MQRMEIKNYTFYTICESVAKSGMSAIIRLFVIVNNRPFCIGTGRVHGCGLDRGFEAAYNVYHYIAKALKSELKYQNNLTHSWM